MELMNLNGATQEALSTEDVSVSAFELNELQLALIGGGIGDTQL